MKTPYAWALVLSAMFLFGTQSSQAQTKPTAEAAKNFLDFYYEGQGKGVILVDSKVCTDVVEAECAESVDPSLLQVGMKYKIWLAFVVPRGDVVNSLSMQFSNEGEVKFARDLSVKGSIRYRTWRSFNPTEPGIWEVKVTETQESGIEEHAKLSLVVSE